ncbi:MAG: hypothetical protein IT349_08200 [Candidatus Eisenbacteria bacterium]|nr:hypothetical protein [Candidatus Eisenbacteria bacterium]
MPASIGLLSAASTAIATGPALGIGIAAGVGWVNFAVPHPSSKPDPIVTPALDIVCILPTGPRSEFEFRAGYRREGARLRHPAQFQHFDDPIRAKLAVGLLHTCVLRRWHRSDGKTYAGFGLDVGLQWDGSYAGSRPGRPFDFPLDSNGQVLSRWDAQGVVALGRTIPTPGGDVDISVRFSSSVLPSTLQFTDASMDAWDVALPGDFRYQSLRVVATFLAPL